MLFLEETQLIPQPLNTHTAKFDLSMELTPVKKGCILRLEYCEGKYKEEFIDTLAQSYLHILEQLGDKKLAHISVLPEDMFHKVIEEFNDTYVEYPKEKCVHELFTEQAAQTPDKTALIFEEKKFTYQELDEMSNSLAHHLQQKGIKSGDSVAVLLKRNENVILTQLAILKLGAIFIPIDNRYPSERIKYILSKSNAKLIIKNKNTKIYFHMEYEIEKWSFQPIKNFKPVHVSPRKPCYVIFTSGSTGQPKGCSLSNQGIVNFCLNNNILNKCNQLKKQICVSVNSISFDFFIAESLLPLLNGYTIVLANEKESIEQDLFSKLLVLNHVNIIQTTPTRYKIFFSNQQSLAFAHQLKILVTSGEPLPLQLLKQFIENTDATIFNPLGPSECSVWAAGGELYTKGKKSAKVDITIGRPIANTQIYILDVDKNPVPIGVPGELYIAGDGVGLGYLNQPELTAERFVLNPFATKENHHGKIMYQTGDLARWRADGEIEYLGRIDTQVKIRGLRIELGEIESAMAGFPGIRLAAAADGRDKSGRQYLTGYYTADEDIDEKALRSHLSDRLPKYMVPNYFVHLDAMPMTPSGKTDRRNLPEPDFTMQERSFTAPQTEIERKLCSLLEELLSLEPVGIQDDFFELGGDSLTAMEYMAKSHSMGIEFSLQDVYDYPTVQDLCKFLAKGAAPKVYYDISDFEPYQCLFTQNQIDESFKPQKKALGHVLLTGATGFLGSHILDQLMHQETGRIYCLIRGESEAKCCEKLSNTLQYYFGNQYQNAIGTRILPVMGDIEQEDFAGKLPDRVQTVIHTAASVRHYGSYEYFHRVNVEGTRHMIDWAKKAGARFIHISTLSVSGNSLADNFSVYRSQEEQYFYESSLYIGQPLENVYIHSKFEAEKAVYDAMLEGLDAKVIRVGNLTNRTSDFKFQPNYKENAFLTREKALLEFGLFPDYLMPLYSEFSPVDLTADGIVRIAQYADRQTVFHLYSNRPVYFNRFLEIVHALGISMKVVEEAEFSRALNQTILDPDREYIYEAFQNDLDENGHLLYDSRIHIVNDFTVWFLKQISFEWNETDVEYLTGYINYFRSLGYFKV